MQIDNITTNWPVVCYVCNKRITLLLVNEVAMNKSIQSSEEINSNSPLVLSLWI